MENQIIQLTELTNNLENHLNIQSYNNTYISPIIPEEYILTTTTTIYQPPVSPKNIIVGRIKL